MPAPTTTQTARLWWQIIGGYLDLQVHADLLGEWDERYAWPHGPAAHDLAEAEKIEARLPNSVVAVVKSGKVPSSTTPCPCGAGIAAGSCHLRVMADAMVLRERARGAEEPSGRPSGANRAAAR